MATSVEADQDGRIFINTASETALRSVHGLDEASIHTILELRKKFTFDLTLAQAVLSNFSTDLGSQFNFQPQSFQPQSYQPPSVSETLLHSSYFGSTTSDSVRSTSSFSPSVSLVSSAQYQSLHNPYIRQSPTYATAPISSYAPFSNQNTSQHRNVSQLQQNWQNSFPPPGPAVQNSAQAPNFPPSGTQFMGTGTPSPPPLIPFNQMGQFQYPPPNLANLDLNVPPPPERNAPPCRQLTLPRGLSFDGSGSWSTFIEKFRDFIFVNRIIEHHEKLYLFRMALTGTASEHLRLIMLHAPSTMESVYSKMESRFGDHELPQSASMQLRYMKQSEGEPVEVWADKVFKLTHQAHPTLPIEDIEMEAVNVFCSGLRDRDIAQTLLCQNLKRVSEAMSFYRRAVHSKRAVHGNYQSQSPSPSRPQIRVVSEDPSYIDINKVDVGRSSATAIADLQVAMARMRSENLANQRIIMTKLDELFSLMKTRPRSADRNPSHPLNGNDRNSSRSKFRSPDGHRSHTSPKTDWSPLRPKHDHRLRSPSPFSGRTSDRSPSRSPGPHSESSLSRERTNSPGSQGRTGEIRCYKCNGVGHFQNVCPSRDIRSVEFSDTNTLDLNSSGSR